MIVMPSAAHAQAAGGDGGEVVIAPGTTTIFDIATDQTLANVVSGEGLLTKQGSATLTLSGANTYTGGTLVSAGTLALGNVTGGVIDAAGRGAILLQGGNLASNVTGTLNNELTIFSSAVIGATAGNTLTIAGALFNADGGSGTRLTFGSSSLTGMVDLDVQGRVVGSGGLAVGGGTLRVGNANIGSSLAGFLDGTTIGTGSTAATLDLNGINTTLRNLSGTSAGVITNQGGAAANLTIISNADTQYDGILTDGTSALSFIHDGGRRTLTLTGNNTFTGGTIINSGTVQIGNGGTTGTLGSGDVTVDDFGALIFNRSDDITVANQISGGGTVFKLGAGTLTLSGANTYTGFTAVPAGTLALGNVTGGVIDAAGRGAILLSGGNLASNVTGTLNNEISIGSGSSAVIGASAGNTLTIAAPFFGAFGGTGTRLTFGSSSLTGTVDLDVQGRVVGSGGLAVGGGTLRVGNANMGFFFTGFLDGATIGTGSTAAILDLNGFDTTLTNLSGTSAGVITNQGGTAANLTITGNTDTQYDGVLTDGTSALSFIHDGSGTLTLSGANTYTGGTLVSAGTLALGNVTGGVIDAAGTGGIVLVGGNLASNVTGTLNNEINIFSSAVIGASAGNTLTIAAPLFRVVVGGGTRLTFGSSSLTGTVDLDAQNFSGGGGLAVGGGTLRVGNANMGSSLAGFRDGATIGTGSTAAILDLNGINTTLFNLTGTSAGVITNQGGAPANLTIFNSADTQYDGVLTDGTSALSFTYDGFRLLTLTGNNTFTGGTTINSGTVRVGNGGMTGTLGSGNVSVTSMLDFNRSDDITVANQISGGGRVFKLGAGTLTLSGANTYTGSTAVFAGTLALGNVTGGVIDAAGRGLIALNGGNLASNVTGTLNNDIFIFSSAVIGASAGNTLTIAAPSFEAFGGGGTTLTFGSSSLTGTVDLDAQGNFFGSGGLTVGGGTLRVGNANIGSSLARFQVGTTIGTGSTAAILDLNGFNTNLRNLSGTSAGVITNQGGAPANLTIINNADTQYDGVLTDGTSALSFTYDGDGALLTLTGNNTFTGGSTINRGGAVQIGNGGTTGTLGSGDVTVNDFGVLIFNRSDDITVANQISGGGFVGKLGVGTLTLSGANTYTGGTLVSAGTLALGNVTGDVIDAAGRGAILLQGGNLASNVTGTLNNQISTFSSAVIGATAGNTLTIAGPSFVALGDTGTTLTFGSSSLTGTVDLDAQVNFIGSGGLAVGGGTLRIGNANIGSSLTGFLDGTTIGTGSTAATLDLNGFDTTLRNLSGTSAGVITNQGGAAANLTIFNSADTQYDGVLTDGTSALSFTYDAFRILTLTGNNTFTGGTTINSGTVQIGNGGTTGTLGSGNVSVNSMLDFNRSDDITVANQISGGGFVGKLGAGTLTLSGANTYSGFTLVFGGTLALGNVTGGVIDAAGTGEILLVGGNLASNVTGTLNNELTILSSALIGATAGNTLTIAGALFNADGGSGTRLTFGSSSLTGMVDLDVQGRVVGSGGLAVGGGTLRVGNANIGSSLANFQDGATIGTGSTAATLDLNGINTTLTNLSGTSAGVITNQGAAAANLTIISNATTQYDGILTDGTSALSFTYDDGGNGTVLTLTGNNTFTGGTTINSGRVQIGNGGTTGTLGSGDVTVGGGLIFNRSDDITVANQISGEGFVEKLGAGTLTLSGANTYRSGTQVSAGTLALGNVTGGVIDAAGRGAIFLLGGNLASNVTGTLNNEIFIGSGSSAVIGASAGNTLTIAAPFFGAFGGTGTRLTFGSSSLTGTVDFAVQDFFGLGGLAVGGGTLRVGNANTGSSLANFQDGATIGTGSTAATLDLNGINTTLRNLSGTSAGVITNQGAAPANLTIISNAATRYDGVLTDGTSALSFTHNGGGTLTLTGNNTFTGGSIINGRVQIGNGGTTGTLGSGDITVDGTLIFNRSDDITVANQISGGGFVDKLGAGTLTLSGANTFTGVTTLTAGGLIVTGSLASGVTVNGGTLGGTGSIGGTSVINSGGTLAAGQSPGTMTFADLALNAGSTLIFELGEAGVAGGPNNDLIRVTGTLALNGGTVSVVRGAGFGVGQYTLFESDTLSGALGNLSLNPLGGGFLGVLAVDGNSVLLNTAFTTDMVYWNGSTISPTGAVVGGDGTWSLQGNNFVNAAGAVGGPWAGNGALAVFGGPAGTVTIAEGEVLSPSGLSFETDGYVITGGDASSGLQLAGAVGIETLTGVGADIAAPISGTGSLTKTGAGTLTLSGANTYTGGTTIIGGTLQLGNNNALGNGSALSVAGATLALDWFNASVASATLSAGSITGSGGTLEIAGLYTQSGGTVAAGATVNVGPESTIRLSGGTIAGTLISRRTSGDSAIINNGAVDVTGAVDLAGNLTIGSGGWGELTINGGGLVNNATGLIGDFAESTGIVRVVDVGSRWESSDFLHVGAEGSGVLQVTEGGFVSSGDGSAIGFGSGSSGTVVVAETDSRWEVSGSLDIGRAGDAVLAITDGGAVTASEVGIAVLAGSTGLLQFGSVAFSPADLAAGTLDADRIIFGEGNGSITFNHSGSDLTLAADISGTGVIRHFAGSTLLSGDLTLGGGIDVDGGTLALGGTVVADGRLRILAPATVAVSGTSTTFGGLEGGGAVVLRSGTLTVGSDNAAALFSGAISGSGGLTKAGTGTFTLTGANSLTGLTTVNAGTLVNSGTIAGGVTNNAALTSTGTIGGALTNNGTALVAGRLGGTVSNAGAITLTGTTTGISFFDQTGTGVLDLAGFATNIGVLSGSGRIVLGNATLRAGTDGLASQFDGVISGSGALNKESNSQLVLTGTHTYTGGTTISGGTLQLGNGGTTGSIAGAIVNNGVLVISRSDVVNLANTISGTGMLVQGGTGTTTLTGTNSHTGGTLVRSGRLVGNTATLQGVIETNGVLEFAQAAGGTFGGTLLGSGRVEKTGAGLLTYTGNGSGLTGPFAVLGGGLRLNGRLDRSVVTLASGTTLSGNGILGGLVVGNGAVVAPGASVGTLNVLGNVTFQSGSRLIAETTESGADLIQAAGTASLAGALEIINIGGTNYAINSAFNLVVAQGGVTGAFDTVSFTGFGTMLRPTLRTTATGLQLFLAPNSLAVVAGAGLTANQAAVAARLDAAVLAGFDPQAFTRIYELAPTALAGALDQLSGEIHPAIGRAAMRQSRLPREAVLERASGTALVESDGNSLGGWGKLIRSWGDVDSDGSAAAQDSDTQGFVIGFDGGSANDTRTFRAGFYGSYLDTRVRIDARGSQGQIEQTGGGVYGSLTLGDLALVVGGGAAHFDITTQRSVAVPGLIEATESASTGDMAQLFGRLGYRLSLGVVEVEPFVAGDHAWIALDRVAEGGGASAVIAGEQDYKVAGATAGIAAKVPLGKLRIDSELAARFELGDRDPQALIALRAAPGQSTRIASTRLNTTAYTGRIGAVLPLGKRMELRVDYTGAFSGNDTEHAAQAGLMIAF